MKTIANPVQFPCGAQSDSFFQALTSALLPALGLSEDTPHWCQQKRRYCTDCGGCGNTTIMHKHHDNLYHSLLTASGTAFAFDYPEDDSVSDHTLFGAKPGWRWPDEFIDFIMRFAGVSWKRFSLKDGKEAVWAAITGAIDAGMPAPIRLGGDAGFGEGTAWQLACGYDGDALLGLDSRGHTLAGVASRYTDAGWFALTDWWARFEDALILTGRKSVEITYNDALDNILLTIANPACDRLEARIYSCIDAATPSNAQDTAAMLIGITGVPIEARWHAGEAFSDVECPLNRLEGDARIKRQLGELIFDKYIEDTNSETHGVCWKLWGLLGAGTHTNYAPAPDSGERLLKPDVQKELKRLFKIVFQNDRDIRDFIQAHTANR